MKTRIIEIKKEALDFLNPDVFSLREDLEKSPENNIQLKSSRKENLPGEAKAGFITNKKYFDEVLKFGKSFLSNEAFLRITAGIEWNPKLGVVEGSKPEFIILCGDYDLAEFGESRTLSAYQTWKNSQLSKENFSVDLGYCLNGRDVNSENAKHFINQFKDFGIIENESDFIPIKIDLLGLSFNKNREGLIYLTENSIFSQTNELQKEDYLFKEFDEYGVPITCGYGETCSVPSRKGLYKFCLSWTSGLYPLDACLFESDFWRRVVRKVA